MNILHARLPRYTNEEHFQFQSDFKALVEQYTPETLNIDAAWAIYQPAYDKEEGTLDTIRKSTFTGDIAGADRNRDSLNSGFENTIKGALNHFDPAKKEAAEHIQVALDHYGNINRKSYDEETAAIYSLVDDLNGKYADDVATLGLQEWVTALKAANDEFVALMQERYSEEAGKPQYNMKTARTEVDAAYRSITERIDALIIVNGEEAYAGFVNDLNERIERYNNAVARREGRNKKDGEEE